MIAGQRGKDCAATCQASGLTCKAALLPLVNHCDALRSHFQCEAGCAEGKGHADAPSYVVYGTVKTLFPALCTYAPYTEVLSCTASAAHSRRLCTCTDDTAAKATAKVAALGVPPKVAELGVQPVVDGTAAQ